MGRLESTEKYESKYLRRRRLLRRRHLGIDGRRGLFFLVLFFLVLFFLFLFFLVLLVLLHLLSPLLPLALFLSPCLWHLQGQGASGGAY